MNSAKILMSIYVALLFFVLSPGVLVALPPGGSRTTQLITHALILGLVWALTHKAVWKVVGGKTKCSSCSCGGQGAPEEVMGANIERYENSKFEGMVGGR